MAVVLKEMTHCPRVKQQPDGDWLPPSGRNEPPRRTEIARPAFIWAPVIYRRPRYQSLAICAQLGSQKCVSAAAKKLAERFFGREGGGGCDRSSLLCVGQYLFAPVLVSRIWKCHTAFRQEADIVTFFDEILQWNLRRIPTMNSNLVEYRK